MSKMMLSFILMFFSFFMIFINHPLSMGFMILLQTMILCLLMGMIIKTYWFSYILFLTFLGGLLVLFIYVSSIASNEKFKTSIKMIIFFFLICLFSFLLSIMFYINLKWMNLFFNTDMSNFNYSFLFLNNNEFKINLSKLYNNQTYMLTILLIIYLFITLVAVVKISNITYGPLRSSFN